MSGIAVVFGRFYLILLTIDKLAEELRKIRCD